MSFDHLDLEHRGAVALLTIARPDKLNALNAATVAELDAAIASLIDDEAIGAVVLTGAGSKAFVAGADIAEIRELGPLEARAFAARGQALMRRIESAPIPVIAAINGFALGGGLELALACHIRYASTAARLGLPEIKLGLIPGFGGTQRLPRVLGRAGALEMMLSGEPIDAESAQRRGLVQRVLEPGELLDRTLEFAASLAETAPVARSRILASVDCGLDLPLERALELELANFALCAATDDMREGTAAFLEKRRPDFTGR